MEPLPQGSGNARSPGTTTSPATSFNGATPSGEWKRGPWRPRRHAPVRFNGATPSGEWKHRQGQNDLLGDNVRFNGATPSGEWKRKVATGKVKHKPLLQWSHSLRGVETTCGEGASAGVTLLQWSHSLRGVETEREHLDGCRLRQASMEPLPQGSGNALRRDREDDRDPASMEPLPQGSGNASDAASRKCCAGCFNGATPSGEWKPRLRPRQEAAGNEASMEPLPQGSGNHRKGSRRALL